MNCCLYLQEASKYLPKYLPGNLSLFVPLLFNILWRLSSCLQYEHFPLCYLNYSSFEVSVAPVCFFSSYRTTKRLLWHYKGNVLKGKCWGQLNLTTQLSSLWHSWAVDISTSFLIYLMEMLPAVWCVCVYINTIQIVFVKGVDCVSHRCTRSVLSLMYPSTLHMKMLYDDSCRKIVAWMASKYHQIPWLGSIETLLSIQGSTL